MVEFRNEGNTTYSGNSSAKEGFSKGMLPQEEINRRYDVLMEKLTTPKQQTCEVSIRDLISGRGSARNTTTYLDSLIQSGSSMTEVRDTILKMIRSSPSEKQWEELGGDYTEPQHLFMLVGANLHARKSGNEVAIS